MRQISKHQLFVLVFLFEVGSTTLFALGIKAKQNSWIVILVAMIIGLGFIWIYTELQRAFPEKNFIEIIIAILGKWLGIPLSLLYAAYLLWPAARNVREFGELIKLTFLPNTPLTVIALTFVLTSLYALSLGIQVFARTSEVTMPVYIFFIIIVFIMIFLSGNVHLKNLTPILSEGIKPVLKEAYPAVTVFPFNEAIIFSMYWCYVDNKNEVRKITMLAIIFPGLLLSVTSAIYISVLGPEYTSIVTIPFNEIVRMVNIGEFISNIDAIAICVIFLGGFYKMSIYLNGITLILATIFKVKKFRLLLTFVSLFLSWVAIAFEPSYTYHLWMYPFDTIYFNTPFLHAIPILLFLIYYLKKRSTAEFT